MKHTLLLLVIAALVSGCISNTSVGTLATVEKTNIQKIKERIKTNQPKVKKAAKNLAELGASYVQKEFRLELALAKAKRLESMQSFLAAPPKEFRETQRAVVLYHLYEVEQAEAKVLEARMAERRASVEEINVAYRRLGTLLSTAERNIEIVSKHLNRSKREQIVAFAETFLGEVKAFGETLAKSDNPRLKKLAADVSKFETAASKAKEDAEKALQTFTALKGD